MCLKNQNPMKHFSAGRKMGGNALEQNKTTNKEASKSCVYRVLKNNSSESKPDGLSWEYCALVRPTELNGNALFVFQRAFESWQRPHQLFKPCWTALRVQLLYLVRDPAEKLRVKQVVGLAGGCVWEVCGIRCFFFHMEAKCWLPQKELSSCTLLKEGLAV